MSASCLVDAAALIDQLGASDCEELGDGFLAQPINAVTSLVYSAVGVFVLVDAWRRRRLGADAWVYGLLLVGMGLGSVLFHGPQPDGSRVLHDLPITLTVLYIVAADIDLLRGGRPSRWVLFVPAAVVATVITVVEVEAGSALTGVGVIALAVAEFLVYRRDLRGLGDRRRRRGAVGIIVIAAVAGAAWFLGRTDSPTCDPDGPFQIHALWHFLSASIFLVWWLLATRGSNDVSQPSTEPAGSTATR